MLGIIQDPMAKSVIKASVFLKHMTKNNIDQNKISQALRCDGWNAHVVHFFPLVFNLMAAG